MPFKSQAQRKYMYSQHPEIAKRWSAEFPNQKNLPKKVKKHKLSINNKLKGSLGQMNTGTNEIQINVKAHKGDRAELASTIKHELMHVKHPKMTEKEVYKKTAKTKIPPQEQVALISKLRHKKLNYKIGAMKRKFKVGRDKRDAGYFISKSNETKHKKDNSSSGGISKEKLSIMGLC